jgi:Secretion system C-terminal sorting domain
MGINFNIYKYDPSKHNSLGDTVYKGFIDYNNPSGPVDIGYYDWEHPSVEFFNPQLPVDFTSSGLIAETVYRNDSSFYQTFGFTSNQEMQLFYYLYTSQLPGTAGINSLNENGFDFRIYPNPMAGRGTLEYTLAAPANVSARIVDITGKEIAVLKQEQEQAGKYSISLGDRSGLTAGMYFVKMTVDGVSYTRKFVVE